MVGLGMTNMIQIHGRSELWGLRNRKDQGNSDSWEVSAVRWLDREIPYLDDSDSREVSAVGRSGC
jgi:hypothetical protein